MAAAAGTTEAPLNCSAHHSCGPCTKSKKCYWCGPTDKCFDYPSKIVPTSCPSNKWYWKQCFLPGTFLDLLTNQKPQENKLVESFI